MADLAGHSRTNRRKNILRGLLLLGRLGLGGVFIYAAYTKLLVIDLWPFRIEWRPWMLFAFAVNSYQLLPEWGVTLVARIMPWLEVALGLLLMLGLGLRYVAAGATLLLAAFFAVMVRAYSQGLSIDCGCFGLGEKLGVATLIRDGLLLLLALAVTLEAFLQHRTARRAGMATGTESASA